VRATAHIGVERHDGRDELVRREAQAPFSVRRCGGRILLAASAAAPVGGDELDVFVTVSKSARADVGTVSATMVWPAPRPLWSASTLTCEVADAATLVWWPEPTVSVARSQHRARTVVRLAPTASCTIVEELVLGRAGEPPGCVDSELRVMRGVTTVLHHRERFGDTVSSLESAVCSSVGVGGARHVLSAILVGVAAGASQTEVTATTAAAWLPLFDDAVAVVAVGPDRPAVWGALARIAPALIPATSQASRPPRE
jgi:urease accessory protein